MKDFFKSARFKILLGVVIVMGGFLLRAAYMGGLGTVSSYTLGVITEPLQKASAQLSGRIADFLGTFLRAQEIKEENEALQKEIEQLRNQMIDYEDYKHQNEQYKQFLEIKDKNMDFQFELASVIGRSPDDRFYSFTIDKGSLDGLALRDPVITSAGLVGYIDELNPTYSKVITILDPSIRVGSQDIRTQDTGIAMGTVELYQNGKCKLAYLDRECGVQAGDIIVTSGIGGIFPKGLMVGTVDQVEVESHGVSMYAVITPSSEIKTVKDVLVIKSFAGQASETEALEQSSSQNSSSSDSAGQ